ncbi:response regulator, partial [Microbacteriaceae bacterium K1510]|nr:response regulator [Microbacteriaceae bacterium K1510]
LVEDNEGVREYARAALEELGYTIIEAANAADALRLANDGARIDLLFTDVVLPGGVSGRQLSDSLLKLRPDLPVLYTTGYTRNAIVHHGRLDPDVHLLNKPYTQQDLLRKVRELLDRNGGRPG